MANATLRYRQAQYKSCPLIIKDGQDAHPTKLGNLFFGVPLNLVQVENWSFSKGNRERGRV
ncbi:hypothetical protein FJR06_10575 [Dolichospermum sp. UHCC 0352]|uniref:hypothetical protein n=1 Tax=Dolichospermum sp. UHCC 0352 TaxID=2590011 RepID=UPI00029B6EEC|nr:hypothetical protein [Dolichospermum sp. UHCC 0352]AFW93528.1 hypothetical protein ANA_C10734 [Anabaena sp. 90]MBO1053900.1 hypothetical protein [Dolichospermum sp. DET73]MTJ19740.1 hypothetical protein [Dolichospermum sp. UHCC 0299]MTJ40062.1 hypothetical protein [Dolichospermum sp. UHCC 0406]MTJ21742.1 hypothetical protein [Dolichospermum sp. UHCC 0352]